VAFAQLRVSGEVATAWIPFDHDAVLIPAADFSRQTVCFL